MAEKQTDLQHVRGEYPKNGHHIPDQAIRSLLIRGSNDEGGLSLEQAPSADEEWAKFTTDLALCLADLLEDEFLIISCKRSTRYVQFAAQGKFGMRAEASGNAYIEPAEAKLSADDYAAMARLGWQLPKGPDPDPKDAPNFFADLRSPVHFESVAELATRTFRQIFGLSHPGKLRYKSFRSAGGQIRWPTLRLKREE